jgi:hypothetical protein
MKSTPLHVVQDRIARLGDSLRESMRARRPRRRVIRHLLLADDLRRACGAPEMTLSSRAVAEVTCRRCRASYAFTTFRACSPGAPSKKTPRDGRPEAPCSSPLPEGEPR